MKTLQRFNKYMLLASSLVMLLWDGLVFSAQTGSVAWRYQTSRSEFIFAPALGKDGTIYVTTYNFQESHILAISPSGSLKWDQSLGSDYVSQSNSPPAIGPDNTVYVCAYRHNDEGNVSSDLYAFSDSGTQKWVLRSKFRNCGELLIGSDGTIYTSGWIFSLYEQNHIIYAINPNGTEKWVARTDEAVTLAALGADGTIYAHTMEFGQTSLDSYIFAFSSIGTEKWRHKVYDITCGRQSGGAVAIGEDGTIYAGGTSETRQGLLYALKPDGTQKWAFLPENHINPGGQLPIGSIVIGADRTIYISSGYRLYAVNPDGTQKWVSEMYTTTCTTPVIGHDGTIFAPGGGYLRELYAINQAGGEVWKFILPGPVVGSHTGTPAISSDGMLYIPVSDGHLYAVNTNSGGLANSAWPMFKRDPQHTGSVPNSKIIPNKGGNTGTVTVRIFGSIIGTEGTTVKLTRNGQGAIFGNPVTIEDEGRSIVTTFDLRGKEAGVYDVQVTQPDGSTMTITNGFTVENGGQAEPWVEILAPSAIRVGMSFTVYLRAVNRGNVDLSPVWLAAGLPSWLSYQSDTPSLLPHTNDSNSEPPSNDGIETLLFQISLIPPGGEQLIPIKIHSVQNGIISITADITTDPSSYFETELNLPEKVLPTLGAPTGDLPPDVNPCNVLNDNTAVEISSGDIVPVPAGTMLYWTDNKDDPNSRLDIKDALPPYDKPFNVHIAKSIGCGQFIDILPDSDEFNNDIKIRNLNDEWLKHQGTLRVAISELDDFLGTKPESGHRQSRRDASLQVYKLGQEGRAKYQDGLCKSDYNVTDGLTTNCFGLYFILNPERANQYFFSDDAFRHEIALITGRLDPKLDPECTSAYENVKNGVKVDIRAVQSVDPNAKYGDSGYGSTHQISPSGGGGYVVTFENLANASAPAQEVRITDHLDLTKMDLNSFSFGPINFGDKVVIPPVGVTEYSTNVDLQLSTGNLRVWINAILEKVTGTVTWTFNSIDNDTGLPPEDPLVGFLPPNKNPPEGQGSVLFTVKFKPDLETGTEIRNKATIVFDNNPAIDTPEWLNTIDNSKPESQVHALPTTQSSTSVEVKWSGTDEGAEIKDYTIFVSEDNGAYNPWITNVADTAGIFTGAFGKTYSFYSVARDLTGNIEDVPVGPDTTTQLVAVPKPGDLNGDGAVTCADMAIVKASFGKRTGQAGFDPRADVNKDGIVDIRDLSFVARLLPAGTKCS